MNAFEIVKNIIPDGINQSLESIWERLQLPDFDEENPKNKYPHFNSPEEWLDSEIYKLTLENHFFEKEYYASKSMMTEETYSGTDFSWSYKAYVPDYFEYKKKWKIDHEKINKIEKCRNEVVHLLANERLTVKEYISSKLQNIIYLSLDIYNPATIVEYTEIWEKAQTEEGKQNVLNRYENRWGFDLHGYFALGNILEIRQKAEELNSNYIEKWNQLIKSQEKEYHEWERKRIIHLDNQRIRQKEIDDLKLGYLRSNPDSIVILIKEILKLSKYNFEFEKEIEIDFIPDTKLLLIEYTLPNIEQLPKIKETKYLTSKKEYRNVEISRRIVQAF